MLVFIYRSHNGNINKHTSQLKMADYCRSCVSKVNSFMLCVYAIVRLSF